MNILPYPIQIHICGFLCENEIVRVSRVTKNLNTLRLYRIFLPQLIIDNLGISSKNTLVSEIADCIHKPYHYVDFWKEIHNILLPSQAPGTTNVHSRIINTYTKTLRFLIFNKPLSPKWFVDKLDWYDYHFKKKRNSECKCVYLHPTYRCTWAEYRYRHKGNYSLLALIY
jgi:hypothetical protein